MQDRFEIVEIETQLQWETNRKSCKLSSSAIVSYREDHLCFKPFSPFLRKRSTLAIVCWPTEAMHGL